MNATKQLKAGPAILIAVAVSALVAIGCQMLPKNQLLADGYEAEMSVLDDKYLSVKAQIESLQSVTTELIAALTKAEVSGDAEMVTRLEDTLMSARNLVVQNRQLLSDVEGERTRVEKDQSNLRIHDGAQQVAGISGMVASLFGAGGLGIAGLLAHLARNSAVNMVRAQPSRATADVKAVDQENRLLATQLAELRGQLNMITSGAKVYMPTHVEPSSLEAPNVTLQEVKLT